MNEERVNEPTHTDPDLERFRRDASHWLSVNMELKDGLPTPTDAEDRQLQAKLADAGYAGLPYPVEYGGRGLSPRHQEAFYEEAAPYRLPTGLGVSLGMIAPTLLDCAAPDFLADHLPRILRGEEKWIQLLSEPGAGSDLAGSLTKAERDGDRWIVNGSKVWSTDAAAADYGFCLARTDFDRPKHRGLSVFALPLRAPGVTDQRHRQVGRMRHRVLRRVLQRCRPPSRCADRRAQRRLVGGAASLVSRAQLLRWRGLRRRFTRQDTGIRLRRRSGRGSSNAHETAHRTRRGPTCGGVRQRAGTQPARQASIGRLHQRRPQRPVGFPAEIEFRPQGASARRDRRRTLRPRCGHVAATNPKTDRSVRRGSTPW